MGCRPRPDRCVVDRLVDLLAHTPTAEAPAADPTGLVDILVQSCSELFGVRLAQIDRVLSAIDGELDRLGGLAAIEIVFQHDERALHGSSFQSVRWYRQRYTPSRSKRILQRQYIFRGV